MHREELYSDIMYFIRDYSIEEAEKRYDLVDIYATGMHAWLCSDEKLINDNGNDDKIGTNGSVFLNAMRKLGLKFNLAEFKDNDSVRVMLGNRPVCSLNRLMQEDGNVFQLERL